MSNTVADIDLPKARGLDRKICLGWKTKSNGHKARCHRHLRLPYIEETFWGRVRGRRLDKLGDTLVCKCKSEYELIGHRREISTGNWEPGPDRSSYVSGASYEVLYLWWNPKFSNALTRNF